MDLSLFYAQKSDFPIRDAFTQETIKMPSAASMMQKPPKWTGGTFQEFAEEAFMADPSRPLALYLHIPFCHHHCTFCPFYINQTKKNFSQDYTTLVLREIELTADILKHVIDKRKVDTIYFGGGTPSDLDEADMAGLLTSLFDHFNIPKTAEVTVEGRTTGFSASKAKTWKAAGANRFSLGIQSANTRLRKRLGRLQSREELQATLNGIGESGASLIIDMLYGLPEQTEEILLNDIQFVSEKTPIDGLDLYELRIFPGSPLAKAIERGKIAPAPSFEDTALMFHSAYHALEIQGFRHFSPKHWRRHPKERSLYNRLASQQCDMIPFGSASGGRLHNIGLGNARDLKSYTEKIESGVKPLSRIASSPLHHPSTEFDKILSSYTEWLCLPPIALWPKSHREFAAILLQQWQDAGLLFPQNHLDEDPLLMGPNDGFRMTSAGYFWNRKLNVLIQQFLNTPV